MKVLKKRDLNKFLDKLKRKYELIAPVKEDIVKFEIIKDLNDICLDEIPRFSAKRFFMPNNEDLFNFKGEKIIKINKEKKQIIFGIRKCDLNAIHRMDRMYMSDPNYERKRKNTILIGYNCKKPDEYCFCNSMGLVDFYDLFLYEDKNNYYIDIGSKKGAELVRTLKTSNKKVNKTIKNSKKLKTFDINDIYYNKEWEKLSKNCLSCSICTSLCPTCFCFDIFDRLDINLKDGSRKRTLSSCMIKSFTKVAGGKIFRDKRNDRFKHFVYHKVVYFKDRFHDTMCVGCGRCIRYCPTNLDWVKLINKLK